MDLQKSLQLLLIILAFLFISLLVYYLIKQAINKIGNSCMDDYKWDPEKKTCVHIDDTPCPNGSQKVDGQCSDSCPVPSKSCGTDSDGLCYDPEFEFCDITTYPNNPIICPKATDSSPNSSCKGKDGGGSKPMICKQFGSYLNYNANDDILSDPGSLNKGFYRVISDKFECTGTGTGTDTDTDTDGCSSILGNKSYVKGQIIDVTDEIKSLNSKGNLQILQGLRTGSIMEKGRTYVILNGGYNFKNCGAINNDVGTTFVYTGDQTKCNPPMPTADETPYIAAVTYPCHDSNDHGDTTYGDVANVYADADTCCPLGQVSVCDNATNSPTKGEFVCVECNGEGYSTDYYGQCCKNEEIAYDPHQDHNMCCNDNKTLLRSRKWSKQKDGTWKEEEEGDDFYCCPKPEDGLIIPVDIDGKVECRFACGSNTAANPYEFCDTDKEQTCLTVTTGNKTESKICQSISKVCHNDGFSKRTPGTTIGTQWLSCYHENGDKEKALYCKPDVDNYNISSKVVVKLADNDCNANDCARHISTFKDYSPSDDNKTALELMPESVHWDQDSLTCTLDYSNLCDNQDFFPVCGTTFTSNPTQGGKPLTNVNDTKVTSWQVCDNKDDLKYFGQIGPAGSICLDSKGPINLINTDPPYYYKNSGFSPEGTTDPCPVLNSYDELGGDNEAAKQSANYFTSKQACLAKTCNAINKLTSDKIDVNNYSYNSKDKGAINKQYTNTDANQLSQDVTSSCCLTDYLFVVNDPANNKQGDPKLAGFCIPPYKRADYGVHDEC